MFGFKSIQHLLKVCTNASQSDATVNATWAAEEAPNPMWSIKAMSRKMGKPEPFWRGRVITSLLTSFVVFAP